MSGAKTSILFLLFICSAAHAQIITTIAGGGGSLLNGVPATSASLGATGLGFFDGTGNYYFADGMNKIRMIDNSGYIYTAAGTGLGFFGDGGLATAAKLDLQGAALDTKGNLYIADFYNYRIRKVDAITHIINTIAGTGTSGYSPDGTLATAALMMPSAVCVDTTGNIFFVDGGGNLVRKIDASGAITTVVGNGVVGFAGDGGPATAAELRMNNSLCMDAKGNLYLACDSKVRVVNLNTGIINLYAGNGAFTYIGDGMPATNAQFEVFQIGFDTVKNNLYISDISNDRVYQVDATGIFHLIAGDGTQGFSGDLGSAKTAQLYNPEGVSVDVCGNVYIADDNNHRIRKVETGTTITPIITLSGITSYPVGGVVSVTATISGACSKYVIHWMNNGVEFNTTTTPIVGYVKSSETDTITARIVSLCGGCYDSVTSPVHIVIAAGLDISNPHTLATQIYPNPTQAQLNIIASDEIAKIYLTNSIGQELYKREFSSRNIMVNIANLPIGVYTVKIVSANGNQTITKIVKE